MDFAFSEDQLAIKDSVAKLCARFDDKYWLKKDKEGGFPEDFYRAMADAGWLGIAMPEEYGGSGLGITEAAMLMQTVAESGAALQGASAIHLNIFGPNPIVVFGTEEQKKRILPDIIKGKVKGCFAVTEPDAGLNTTALDTKAERDGNGYIVHGKKTFTTTALGRRQDAADRPHHAQGQVQEADRRPVAVLHRLRPLQDRGAPRSTRWAARRSTPTRCSSTA